MKFALTLFAFCAIAYAAGPIQRTPEQMENVRSLTGSMLSNDMNALVYECIGNELREGYATTCVEVSGRAFGKYIVDEITGDSQGYNLDPIGQWDITEESLTRYFEFYSKIYDLYFPVVITINEESLYIDVTGPTQK